MKVTFFIGGLSGGGAERVVCQLSSYLVKKNYEVEILTVSESGRPYSLDERVSIKSLDSEKKSMNRVLRIFQKLMSLRRYVIQNETDVYVAFLTYSIAAMALMRRIVKVPIIASSRNDPSLYPFTMKKILMWAIKRVDGVVNQTTEIDEYFKKCIAMKSSTVIPNAISSEFKPYYGKREKKIVTAGRFNKQKNIPLLLNSFARLSKEYPDYRLVIYGEGILKTEYIDIAKELGILDQVDFPGYVSNVSEKMKDAAMFVLPSDYEGISNALIEAMATGIPCISTDSLGGGSRMLIKDHENGLLVPRSDVDKMYYAMKEYIDNPELANNCGFEASKIPSVFAPDNIYHMWEEYILSIYKQYKGV